MVFSGVPEAVAPLPICQTKVWLSRNSGRREVGREVRLHADWAGARAAAAVGRRERLVEVEVDDVEAHVAEAGAAEEGVLVGAVAVEEGAGFVDHLRDLSDVGVEEAEGGGEGQHHRSYALVEVGREEIEVGIAVGVRGDGDDLEAGHGGGRGVGAVGGVGDEHLAAAHVAALQMVVLDHQNAGKLTLGAGGRSEADGVHAGDLGERFLQFVEDGQRALYCLDGLLRMDVCEAWEAGHVFVYLRVVLHRAGAERVEAGVDAVVQPAQAKEVADDFVLRHFGEGEVAAEETLIGEIRDGDVEGGHEDAGAAGVAAIESEALARGGLGRGFGSAFGGHGHCGRLLSTDFLSG